MNHKKSHTDYSDSTFSNYVRNGKLPFTALFSDSVQQLLNQNLKDRQVRTWILMQPVLGAHGGYLLDDSGGPLSLQDLSGKLWRSAEDLGKDIDKLIKFDL